MKRALLAALAWVLLAVPTSAQWQVPEHSLPIGRGSGTGFKSVGPCLAGVPIVGAGTSADPVCSSGISNNQIAANISGSTGPAAGATPTSIWDSFCSTTIGNFWVRMSSGWGCTSLGYANPEWWGADPTGAADSASAFNSAIATKLPVRWSKGTFKINSVTAWNLNNAVDSAVMSCAGNNLTHLNWPNASGGITVTFANLMNNVHFSDCHLTTSQVNSGTAVNIQGVGTGSAPWSTFSNLSITGDDYAGTSGSKYWATGINIKNAGDITIRETNFYGPIDATGGGVGIAISGQASPEIYATVVNIIGGSYNFARPGISLGNHWQGVSIININCNGGTAGNVCVQQSGSATGVLALLLIKDSQMNVGGSQIELNSAIDNLTVVDNPGITCSTNNCAAIAINSAGIYYQIANNLITKFGTPTGTTGVLASGTQGIVTGNIFSGLGTGVNLQASTSNWIVRTNLYPSVTTPTVDSGTTNAIGNVALQATPSNPTGTSSATQVMMGVGGTCKLTPVNGTRIKLEFHVGVANGAVANASTLTAKFGTGTAPTNGAAVTGTSVGTNMVVSSPGASYQANAVFGGIITGLTRGTQYWFDVALSAQANTSTLQAIDCNAIEF